MRNVPNNQLPNSQIIDCLSNQRHPYALEDILGPRGYELGCIEYKRCLELFNQFGTTPNSPREAGKIFTGLISCESQIKREEKRHQHVLTQLAIDTVKNFFGISNEIKIDAQIQTKISPQPDHNPPESKDIDTKALQTHIKKRIILNALVHGSAIHLWKSLSFLAEARLNEINPKLLPLYNKFTADSSMMMWQTPPIITLPEEVQQTAYAMSPCVGQNKIKINPDSPLVSAVAINFPTMIHEIIKGVMDVVILHGLDSSLSQEEQQYIMSVADKHQDEYWYYLTGPSLWQLLMKQIENPHHIPEKLMDISKSPYDKITNFFNKALDEL